MLIIVSTWFTATVLSMLPEVNRPESYQEHPQSSIERFYTSQTRYLEWISGLVNFDLGYSDHFFGAPVIKYILSNFIFTFMLSLFAVVSSSSLGILIGVHEAIYQSWRIQPPGRHTSIFILNLFRYLLYVINAVPTYIIAILLLIISPGVPILVLVLLSLCLGSGIMMDFANISYNIMDKQFSQPYVINALSIGLKPGGMFPVPKRVSWHAFRSLTASIIPLVGSKVPFIVGNVLVLEIVFGLPGLSEPLLGGLIHKDIPLVLSVLIFTVISTQVVSAITEIIDFLINPGKQFLI